MNKLRLIAVAALVAATFVSRAEDSRTRDIDISVELSRDGSALVREVWSIDIYRGTEWYLVRENLGDIRISDFRVWDESGREFALQDSWDVDWSRSRKEGRCSIVRKRNGCELCWGLGSYGPHRFTAQYRMSNAVKSMDDYDALHLQLVSPGISPRPENIRVVVSAADTLLDSGNSAIWAFGFNGTDLFEDGKIVLRTTEAFSSDNNSVILLARFNKGIFASPSRIEGPFEEKLSQAFKGSSYQDFLDAEEDEEKVIAGILAALCALTGLGIFASVKFVRARNRRIFGVKRLKEIGYERDLPFNGNLYESRLVLSKIGVITDANFASALILRMVREGIIRLRHDSRGKVELDVSDDGSRFVLNPSQREFYNMLREASGGDLVLQDKEYSRWSKKNEKRVARWIEKLDTQGELELYDDGYARSGKYSPEGQMHARRVVGFKKYLKDFTLLDERKTTEVALWGDYIVFAALFGIADKVAAELKDINPQAFEEVIGCDYPTMRTLVLLSNHVGNNVVSSATHYQTASSTSGGGGFSSLGGGGGFSGGGFGGGAR